MPTFPPDLQQMVLVAFFNPATILVAYLIGRRADQAAKVLVAAFAAAFAGLMFAMLLDAFGIYIGYANAVGGIFAMSFVYGLVWAYLGYVTRPKDEDAAPAHDGE
ncbi:MAG: hypothetical protein AAFR04_09495 [Pseudomonadota bacterium]